MKTIAAWWSKQRFQLLTIGTFIYVVSLLVLIILWKQFAQREGTLALVAILLPYLFVPLFLLIPFLFWRLAMALRIVLLVGVVLFVACFPPRLWPGHTSEGTTKTISALTWNLLGSNERAGYVRALLQEKMPDIVALQEADWVGMDQAEDLLQQYPHHLYRPADGVPPGEILLSVYPIVDYGTIEVSDSGDATWDIPRVLWARLDLGAGHTILVVNAHPISAVNTTYRCLFCAERRDSQVKALSAFLQPFIAQGEQILLLGDMNTTDRELAYHDLTTGLIDTHLQVGNGSGHTWGIRGINRFWAFLRIDYMLVTPNITPLSLDTDCASRGSDHCVLTGQFSV